MASEHTIREDQASFVHEDDRSKLQAASSSTSEGINNYELQFIPISANILTVNAEKDVEVAQDEKPNAGPDGGYGWLVVVGGFLVQVTTFGVISSWYIRIIRTLFSNT